MHCESTASIGSSGSRHASLLARVRSRYATVTETIRVGHFSLEFTRVAEPDRVLEELEAAAETCGTDAPAAQPYWAEAWDSALALADILCSRNLLGQSLLDLGCGMGLTGTVAAAMGARVMMVDIAATALLFARLNSWQWRERVSVRQFNWRTQQLDERFDLILGSDILYDRNDWPHLENLWCQHLHPAGQILLTEPGRRAGDEFIEWLDTRVWKLRTTWMPPAGPAPNMRLFAVSFRNVDR